MEIRHFSHAGYTLEGQLWRRFNLNSKHAAEVRMEQAEVSLRINQGNYIFVSVTID